ncbi:SDR family NAD(P)-dependent oxidoreductase [Campylobacter sp. LR291e]|uniref:SDR family NAD(P)-dependent oxidoreductase n=1 Tax=unclassified Campylobacter TaxID=2593542 RepID=UPI00123A44EF|nr:MULTISPECIES: SDR family NAD(P)-dependent oxidoreductase [unclassified Campylobacter]KAA6230331.1 SDR family NAD(P)-dependent oxidoreductase [Campylobacter sp. LR291e]KAA6233851.1 SDR family NAD(P)-dependent oxidoreductase [Campylobacter sp. LR264d]
MKTAFITGASSGFGQACARVLAKNNYKIIALARRKEKLQELKEEFKDRVHILNIDVRDKDAIFNAVKNLPSEFMDIEILLNNAGLALGLSEFDKADIEDIETMIDTNVKGFLYVAKVLIPILRKQESAYIFNIGSVAARNPYFGGNVYCGTKAFVGQFSLALRNDLRDSNIKVTNIAPGLCKTEFSEVRFHGDKKKADAVYENTKYLSADDIAQVILALIKLPSHINVNEIELMPQTQTWAGFHIQKLN